MGIDEGKNIEQLIGDLKVPKAITKEDAWRRLERRIQLEQRIKKPVRKKIAIYPIITATAAAVFLYFLIRFRFDSPPDYSSEMVSTFGEVKECWLPDSSLVALNSNSSVRYSYDKFSGKRSVLLKGDALFDVNKGKDFIVSFYGGEVRVKGTSFYVSAYTPSYLQVDCVEGAVEVTLKGSDFLLKKGQGVKCFEGTLSEIYSCTKEDVKNKLEGTFYWEKVTLAEIDELAEYRLGYSILLEPGLESRKFSGQLNLTNIEEAMLIISVAMNVSYSINEERKTISINAR